MELTLFGITFSVVTPGRVRREAGALRARFAEEEKLDREREARVGDLHGAELEAFVRRGHRFEEEAA